MKDDVLFANLFVSGALSLSEMKISVKESADGFPYAGKITFDIEADADSPLKAFAVRIPGWSRNTVVKQNGERVFEGVAVVAGKGVEYSEGFLYFRNIAGHKTHIELLPDMTPVRVYANWRVADDNGKCAVMRGPLVYCAEGIDQQHDLFAMKISSDAEITESAGRDAGWKDTVFLETTASFSDTTEELYTVVKPKEEECGIRLLPYYLWANRGLGKMRVWIPER